MASHIVLSRLLLARRFASSRLLVSVRLTSTARIRLESGTDVRMRRSAQRRVQKRRLVGWLRVAPCSSVLARRDVQRGKG